MATYRVKAGSITQADYNLPEPQPDPKTGVVVKRPSKTYRRGEVFESPWDEVARCGHEQVEYLGGSFEPVPNPTRREYAFPGGQVLQGSQVTTAGADGSPVTGAEGAMLAQSQDPAAQAGREAAARQNANAFKTATQPKAPAARPVPTVAQLEAMGADDLRAYAKDEGLDVKDTANKGELIKAIRAGK